MSMANKYATFFCLTGVDAYEWTSCNTSPHYTAVWRSMTILWERDIVHQPRTFTSPCATNSAIRTYIRLCSSRSRFTTRRNAANYAVAEAALTRAAPFHFESSQLARFATFGFFSSLIICRRMMYLRQFSLRNRWSFCNMSRQCIVLSASRSRNLLNGCEKFVISALDKFEQNWHETKLLSRALVDTEKKSGNSYQIKCSINNFLFF